MSVKSLATCCLPTVVFLLLFLPGYAQITPTQMGMYDFAKNQALTADEMNGIADITMKLQAAVNTARDARQTLFISSGTYKVSSQIYCEMTHDPLITSNNYPNMPVNIVGSAVDRPTIVLTDNTPVFNGANPLAIFHYMTDQSLPSRHYNPGQPYDPAWVMQGGIRGLNIDLGKGNSNAVGIFWSTAQYCYVEDISINARDGFAGMTGIGGANCLTANIHVDGGQYGFYLPNKSEEVAWGMPAANQNTITGCIFTNQSKAALVLSGWGGITLVGSSIVQAAGTAIKLNTGSAVEIFPFSMIDCKIEFTSHASANIAVLNSGQGLISLRNVYVKGAGTLVDNNGDGNLENSGKANDWTHLRKYNYVNKAAKTNSRGVPMLSMHYDAITAVQSNTDIVDFVKVTAPPEDLVSKHLWKATPSFEDPDAVLITSTTAAGIQQAIDNNTKVCLPKGTFTLSSPIILKENTILIGCPGRGRSGTIFEYGWTPEKPSWLIETVNSPSATTYLFDITTKAGDEDYRGSVHWQAGANSIIRNLWCDIDWLNYEHNYIRLFISGNGGGRIFNYQDEKGTRPSNSSHRKVKVSGTSQPLTFYGLNLERGGSERPVSIFPMLEIENASNIRIFGGKTETSQPYATIDNSHNIFITNVMDFAHFGSYKQNYIEITGNNSDNIEITNCIYHYSPSASYLIVDDPWNTNEVPRTMVLGCYHRNWSSFE
ncbi:MAG: hypothetical protein DHS20C17_18080 [Cyclobacteriaceae bacterium]|nr:MAG: hypothetical protein DHS20C17_18080 [Cyclobacteriaceae bacterium]